MSVYIKGMGMPTSCEDCPMAFAVNFGILCTPTKRIVGDGEISKRQGFCPLVPVPEHGRLGDLEQAVIILERLRDHCGNEDMAFALNWAANTIRDLPTIITADKEGE